MKKILWIAFVVVVLAIVTPVVLVATLPTARVTITAIGPTGKVFTRTNMTGEVVSGPEWLFGITNVGRAPATWVATVQSRQWVTVGELVVKLFADVPPRVLPPGEGLVAGMIVPTGEKITWFGTVGYFTEPSPFQRGLWHLRARTPGLRRLLPKPALFGDSETVWHPATNAPLASSTVTNTP